jgi:hypothetical protein
MMNKIKFLLGLLVILAIITFFYFRDHLGFSDYDPVSKLIDAETVEKAEDTLQAEEIINTRLEEKAREALEFCDSSGFNTDYCILIDMEIHSGKHRMFIYDFNEQKIERAALCAHGSGKGDRASTGDKPIFGNEDGSWLTSLGKYRLGVRSYSKWGINIHYKMHGLEKSNSNAFKRIVVLHSYTPLPAEEIYPAHLPMGWSLGCPVTDDETMTYLDVKLQESKKPVLLRIYY